MTNDALNLLLLIVGIVLISGGIPIIIREFVEMWKDLIA